ncbi:MAG: hypothetical protein D6746_07525 [Bacteroidetes bacterium]|nr:MAG: hypothetical protein D6746_07525 [Bacteroidota bacterium]
MAYKRTEAQRRTDWKIAKEFEGVVRDALIPFDVVDRTSSSTEIDFWVPGWYLDVKEKRQPLTRRWHLLDAPEEELFILDELGVRKLLQHWPFGYMLLHDVPRGRLFVASCVELACVERVRVMRVGKGKWVVDLRNFRQINRVEDLVTVIRRDLAEAPWGRSECLGQVLPPQVAD